MKLYLSIWIYIFVLLSCTSREQLNTESSHFSFDVDERLFTAHAFINVGGYDLEYNDSGMHPIRHEIRALLKATLPESYQDSIQSYYNSHEHYLGMYGTYAFTLSSPPILKMNFDSVTSSEWITDQIAALPGLDEQLHQFYHRAGISQIWQDYRPRLQELNDQFRPHAANALTDLKTYLKIEETPDPLRRGKIVTAFSPLLSYFQAFTTTVNGDVYMVFGPQPNAPSPSSYYHETAHHFIDPIVQSHPDDLEPLTALFDLADNCSTCIGYSYPEESLVRTIDIILTGRLYQFSEDRVRQSIDQEYRLGFILCPYFYENLPAFEESGENLAEYFPILLAGIDIDREIQRWQDFWNTQETR